MRLYCTSDGLSQAAQIAFYEAGIELDIVRVNLRTLVTSDGDDFTNVSPFGQVPVFAFPDGTTIREIVAILVIAASLAPPSELAPPSGTVENARLFEWLSFLSVGMYPELTLICRDDAPFAMEPLRASLRRRMTWIDVQLSVRPYLLRSGFSIADIYLWSMVHLIISGWKGCDPVIRNDVTALDNIRLWYENLSRRPSVRTALALDRCDVPSAA